MPWWNSIQKYACRLKSGLYMISKAMAAVAAFVLAIMMFLTVMDVIGRYFLSRPVPGAWETIGLLLICAGTWGLGYCQEEKSHIKVTIILEKFPLKVQFCVRGLAYLIGAVGFSLICWRTFLLGVKYFVEKGHVTDILEIPYYPFVLMLSISCGLLALTLIKDLFITLIEVVRQ